MRPNSTTRLNPSQGATGNPYSRHPKKHPLITFLTCQSPLNKTGLTPLSWRWVSPANIKETLRWTTFLHLSSCVGHGWDCLSVGDFISRQQSEACGSPPTTDRRGRVPGSTGPRPSGERPPVIQGRASRSNPKRTSSSNFLSPLRRQPAEWDGQTGP